MTDDLDQLDAALRRDIPDLDAHLAKGDPMPAVEWLRARVHVHGALKEPAQVIADATGETPTEGPLLDYLDAKFGALYDV